MTAAQVLQAARERLGLSIPDLAGSIDRAGEYAYLEKGSTPKNAEYADDVCRAYQLTPEERTLCMNEWSEEARQELEEWIDGGASRVLPYTTPQHLVTGMPDRGPLHGLKVSLDLPFDPVWEKQDGEL
jgi:hypothetical protein